MEPVRAAVVLATIVLSNAMPARGQTAPSLDDPTVRAQVDSLVAWASEPAILQAVLAHNERGMSMDAIEEIDARWVAGAAESELEERLNNACAERLNELLPADEAYREALVMDDQGALVCLTGPSSDYWQGDEAKWQRTFDGGQVFVDRPRYDSSTRAILVQISVPIVDGDRTIGVLTVGIDRARFEQ